MRTQLGPCVSLWAGFEELDVYLLSASFPNGTDSSYDPYDRVHYKETVFKPAEEILILWSILGLGMTKNNDERKQPYELNAHAHYA